jgi:hypothetical protein
MTALKQTLAAGVIAGGTLLAAVSGAQAQRSDPTPGDASSCATQGSCGNHGNNSANATANARSKVTFTALGGNGGARCSVGFQAVVAGFGAGVYSPVDWCIKYEGGVTLAIYSPDNVVRAGAALGLAVQDGYFDKGLRAAAATNCIIADDMIRAHFAGATCRPYVQTVSGCYTKETGKVVCDRTAGSVPGGTGRRRMTPNN